MSPTIRISVVQVVVGNLFGVSKNVWSEQTFVPPPSLKHRVLWTLSNKNQSINQTFLVEFIHLVFTSMLGESYRRRLRSLLVSVCDVFRALTNSLDC